MTVERTYKCNLCKAKKEPDKIHGLYWCFVANRSKNTRDGWTLSSARDTETHVCFQCAADVHSIVEKKNKPEDRQG